MDFLNSIKAQIPDTAKDIRLNEVLAELARQAATRPGAG